MIRLMGEFGQRRFEEGEQIGEKRGSKIASLEIAKRLLNNDMPIDKVSEVTNVPIEKLKNING